MDSVTEISLQPGSQVTYQNKSYQIRQLAGNLKTVVLEDPISGRLLNAPIAHLLPPAPAAEVTTLPVVPLELVSDEQWAIAQQRLAIIQPLLARRGDGQLVQEVAQRHDLGQATLYRSKLPGSFHSSSQAGPTVERVKPGCHPNWRH
jgi:putative transposase